MSDLIDREAAIRKIEPWLYSKGRGESEINMLRAVIAELKSLPASPRWVRCEEGLPKDSKPVICWEKQGFPYVDRYFKKYGWEFANNALAEPIYWMPLPEPPKEGE